MKRLRLRGLTMSDWQEFEEFVRRLTIEDGTKRTPLSGGTKHEEDVVGNTLICQCKCTEEKNFHILEKDFTRLLEASKLLEKFPLFFSQSSAGKIMSIPILKETEDTINTLLMTIMLHKRLIALLQFTKNVKDERAFLKAKSELAAVGKLSAELSEANRRELERIRNILSYIEDDLTMYNLFDGQPDEPKN